MWPLYFRTLCYMVITQKLVTKARGCCEHLLVLRHRHALCMCYVTAQVNLSENPAVVVYSAKHVMYSFRGGKRRYWSNALGRCSMKGDRERKLFQGSVVWVVNTTGRAFQATREPQAGKCPSDNNFYVLIASIFCGIWTVFSALISFTFQSIWYIYIFKYSKHQASQNSFSVKSPEKYHPNMVDFGLNTINFSFKLLFSNIY